MRKMPFKEVHKRILDQYALAGLDLNKAFVLKFEPGEIIIREGLPMEYLLFVVSGRAKVFTTTSQGKDLLLYNYLTPRQTSEKNLTYGMGLIGDVELMTGSHTASTTMQAATEFICVALPFRVYGEVLRSNIKFINKVGEELALKLLRNSKNYAITALYSGEERLSAYILHATEGNIFKDKLSDVANFIGVSYRHLLRMLKDLTEQKILKKHPEGYIILKKQKLAEFTEDLYLK